MDTADQMFSATKQFITAEPEQNRCYLNSVGAYNGVLEEVPELLQSLLFQFLGRTSQHVFLSVV